MELKYYLRGLGLGIVMTAIIMGVAASRSRSMTDAEIIARAKQLGMIEGLPLTESVSGEEDAADGAEQDVKSDSDDLRTQADGEQNADTRQNADTSVPGEENGDDTGHLPETDSSFSGGQADNPKDPADGMEAGAQEQTQPEEDEQFQMPEPDEQEAASSQEVMAPADTQMVVTIGSGDGSYEVSQKLADIGAVSSAAEYDTYLCENGFDKRIRAGVHTIPAGASEEQIARIIMGIE